MKKLFYILIVLLLYGLVWVAQASQAALSPLSDHELEAIGGQGGIVLSADHLGLDMSFETLYYGDEDGPGTGAAGGYLSLCGVSLNGSVQWATPMTIEVGNFDDLFSPTKVDGIRIAMNDITIQIDRFRIDAIRVGQQPGSGESFGSFGIDNMHVNISGNLMIYAH